MLVIKERNLDKEVYLEQNTVWQLRGNNTYKRVVSASRKKKFRRLKSQFRMIWQPVPLTYEREVQVISNDTALPVNVLLII